MPTTESPSAAGTPLRLTSIDDYLGPSETRFFGRGYRRAVYDVRDVVVRAGDVAEQVRAVVSIGYPVDWSTKSDIGQRPHLSTVDILVLGIQLSEVHLARGRGLDDAGRRAAWVRKATLKAGTAPQESLVGLDATVVLQRVEALPASSGAVVSVYRCAIGQMQARLEIVHAPAGADGADGSYPTLESALGPGHERYYGAGFTGQQHRIRDVEVAAREHRAEALLQIGDATDLDTVAGTDGALPAGGLAADGVEGDYRPAPTMVDCFVANLQLAQVLMYELDGVPRQDSNTLWMLKTVLRQPQPQANADPDPDPDPDPQPSPVLPIRASITAKHLVPLRGGLWRNVDLAAECGDISMVASFAHELPSHARSVGPAPRADSPDAKEHTP